MLRICGVSVACDGHMPGFFLSGPLVGQVNYCTTLQAARRRKSKQGENKRARGGFVWVQAGFSLGWDEVTPQSLKSEGGAHSTEKTALRELQTAVQHAAAHTAA